MSPPSCGHLIIAAIVTCVLLAFAIMARNFDAAGPTDATVCRIANSTVAASCRCHSSNYRLYCGGANVSCYCSHYIAPNPHQRNHACYDVTVYADYTSPIDGRRVAALEETTYTNAGLARAYASTFSDGTNVTCSYNVEYPEAVSFTHATSYALIAIIATCVMVVYVAVGSWMRVGANRGSAAASLGELESVPLIDGASSDSEEAVRIP